MACSGIRSLSGPSAARASGVCAGGTRYGWAPSARVRGQVEHFGAQCREHAGNGDIAVRAPVGDGRVHAVEVVDHRFQGLLVDLSTHLDDRERG